MIESMTGFGRGEATSEELTAVVEMRSLNSRFCEVQVRLPRVFSAYEAELREYVRRELARGKIMVTVELRRNGLLEAELELNEEAAQAVYALLERLRKSCGIADPVRLEHVLQFREVLSVPGSQPWDEQAWTLVRQAAQQALEALRAMRRQEGQALAADLAARVRQILEHLELVERRSRERLSEYRDKLRERVRQLLSEDRIDPNRLELEIVLLAERADITEECVRLRSHCAFFLEALESPEPAGRRLNFLLQEMHREANTIGAKSLDAEISWHVVAIKEELERIREQVQNIE
ncbi:MAG: YicC family protein [Bacteroidetes bacterium]|nr:YicC family protein [Rhodothermia bacterium]MCS7154293.1 YicC family protein [Bacteroidota bacterium]MCX7906671.1 YicC family protein [Bacteroidota bacterium]MDW8137049.1 YicC/YloC family endoribonuclease [Bacteroidota bacterium]MDW8285080.1 YicC/YloC family endoribonuclease [Bacteroidota bacterium]